VLSLQDSFDRFDGIGVLCSDRAPKAVSFGAHVADAPSCWMVEDAHGRATVSDPDLGAMPVSVEITASGSTTSVPTVKTSVGENVRAPVPNDEHVWIWSDGASAVRASVAVPRFASLSPKVRVHLESIDAAVRSLR
jgi:hypothetical protein